MGVLCASLLAKVFFEAKLGQNAYLAVITDRVGSLVQYGEFLMMVIALRECQDFSFEPCLISILPLMRPITFVLDTKILIP